jgi:hypothetical protein
MDRKLIGTILLVLGVLALVYGGFTYTRKTHEAEIGPVDIEVRDREHVNVPMWAGVAFVVGGAALILTRPQMR